MKKESVSRYINKKTVYGIVIVLFTILIMVLYWRAYLAGGSRPIAHQADIMDGKFNITVGQLREIKVRSAEEKNNIDLRIIIKNSEERIVFEKEYLQITVNNNFQTIDYYTREEPVTLPTGGYYATFLVNGSADNDIRGRFIEYSGNYNDIYKHICIIMVTFVVCMIGVTQYSRLKPEYVYLILAISLGILWNIIAPPLAAPDEYSHFIEAYALSNRMCGQEEKNQDGYVLVRAKDYDNINYLHNMATISEWYSPNEEDNDEMVPVDVKSTVSIRAKYTYLISAITITVVRALGAGGKVLLLSGRIANLVLCSLIMALSIKIAPYCKKFFLCLGLIPEVLLLAASYSYDGLNFAMCMMVVAYYMYLTKCQKIDVKELVIFILLIIIMLPIKVVYCAFALLLLLLPKEKLNIPVKYLNGILIMGGIGVSIYLLLNVNVVLSVMGINSTEIVSMDVDQGALFTLNYALQNIEKTMLIFFRTILENIYEYVRQAIGLVFSLTKEGDLTGCGIPYWLCDLVIVNLILSLEDSNENNIGIGKRIVAGGIGLVSIGAVLVSMLFASTAICYYKIGGIQGRYFLPVLTLMPIIIKNNKFKSGIYKGDICTLIMIFANVAYAFWCFGYMANNYF